ncbi:hypothetical protein Tco_0894262 [Tanacetum coccineum]|uniref:Uncharacterized protein n=1 Tax=Tanacetum coccineum TaxID=301880 RepID=A0ABQ5CB61_9ASTR
MRHHSPPQPPPPHHRHPPPADLHHGHHHLIVIITATTIAAIPPCHPHRCHDSPTIRLFVSVAAPPISVGLIFTGNSTKGVRPFGWQQESPRGCVGGVPQPQ